MDDEYVKKFTKNFHNNIRNGKLVRCQKCSIHCLIRAEDVGKFKNVNGECNKEDTG